MDDTHGETQQQPSVRQLNHGGCLTEHEANFKIHFENMGLSEMAQDFLLLVWRSTQFYDDLADGDNFTRDELDVAIWDHFVGLPTHPFMLQYGHLVAPVLQLLVLKWHGSDQAERANEADARSYMWRAGFYDVLIMVASIDIGPRNTTSIAKDIMHLYGETFKDYKKEFPNG